MGNHAQVTIGDSESNTIVSKLKVISSLIDEVENTVKGINSIIFGYTDEADVLAKSVNSTHVLEYLNRQLSQLRNINDEAASVYRRLQD